MPSWVSQVTMWLRLSGFAPGLPFLLVLLPLLLGSCAACCFAGAIGFLFWSFSYGPGRNARCTVM